MRDIESASALSGRAPIPCLSISWAKMSAIASSSWPKPGMQSTGFAVCHCAGNSWDERAGSFSASVMWRSGACLSSSGTSVGIELERILMGA